jgi:hypothetical protein
MHSDEKTKERVGDQHTAIRRTTIILDKNDREFVNSLIAEKKETGIKPLISKMLNIYKNMMIHDWRFPGEYYFGISRMAFVNAELFNILSKQIPQKELRATGRKMGQALRVSVETTFSPKVTENGNAEDFLNRLQIQGFGEFSIKDKYLLIKAPYINEPEMWVGLLEGLLGTELEVKTAGTPIVMEIKKKRDGTITKQI